MGGVEGIGEVDGCRVGGAVRGGGALRAARQLERGKRFRQGLFVMGIGLLSTRSCLSTLSSFDGRFRGTRAIGAVDRDGKCSAL